MAVPADRSYVYIFPSIDVAWVIRLNAEKPDESRSEQTMLSILKGAAGPLTTREIQELARKALVQCPDSTVAFLNRLRIKGLVRGTFSKEKQSWIWWTEAS
jgi:hypothetical protein